MNLPECGKLYWLVRLRGGRVESIGFICSDRSGAFVIGGPTDSHCTGHGEGWRRKWEEIHTMGFIDAHDAKRDGLIPESWKPPSLCRVDRKVLRTFEM